MTTLAEVRDALGDALEGIPGLRVYRFVRGSVNPPAAIILPPTIPAYSGDLDDGDFEVRLRVAVVQPTALERQQLDLWPFFERTGDQSIYAALEADRTLGFPDVDARVVSADQFEAIEIAGVRYTGGVVNLSVFLGG